MESLSIHQVRRLALCRAGLLKPDWSGFLGSGSGCAGHEQAQAIIDAFGYLQLDTISIAGARSHTLVLLSRLQNFSPRMGEELLTPGAPLFEYWGHEACWMPMSLYPAFQFRRDQFRTHPWWGDIIAENPKVHARLLDRIRTDGPLRSADMEGGGGGGWWDFKLAKQVATAMWSSGELAIRERNNFHRSFDLTERVIPAAMRRTSMTLSASLCVLLLRALAGHGWATTGTLAATWRLRNLGPQIKRALNELEDAGEIVPCTLGPRQGRPRVGWVRPDDLKLAGRLDRARPPRDHGVLLSPFDPVLWDRKRVAELFSFDQVLEVFKPAEKRLYGYYCMPVLAGDTLIARVDLKAERKQGRLEVLSVRYETTRPSTADKKAVTVALKRYSKALELTLPTRFR